MKRALVLSLSATLLLALGCGTRSYEIRLSQTLATLKYRQRLDLNLSPPAEDKFKELNIFLRPPKPLSQTKEFQLTSVPGLFDLEASFVNLQQPNDGLRLYVLARRKAASKGAAKKKEAAPPAEAAQRGPFKEDVFRLLAGDLGVAEGLQSAAPKDFTARKNSFKRVIVPGPNNSDLRIYLYSRDGYDVALVFAVPKAQEKTSNEGIVLCLESFAVGGKATRAFQSGFGDEETTGPGGGGEGAPAVF